MSGQILYTGRGKKIIKYFQISLCFTAAFLGSFVCRPAQLALWYMLVFCAYTDMRTAQVYVFPIRVCIACELILLICRRGVFCGEQVRLLFSLAVIVLMKVIGVYAQGDMEIFIMLVMAAGINGEETVGYSMRLLATTSLIFVVLFGIYFCVYNCIRKLHGGRLMFVKKAPMAPSIAIAFILCHLCG